MIEVLMYQLETDKMKLEDCQSHCYENAEVMAGHRSGVQQRIKLKKTSLAVIVNWDNQ